MPPTGATPGQAAIEIVVSLHTYAKRTGRGRAVGDNVGFLVNLPDRQSFSPDAAFWTGNDSGMKFYDGAPVFAVEVRSESDYGPLAERNMAAKRADYFAAGTLGACPRIENLLRKSPFGQIYRSFSLNSHHYSPQMIEKSDSKWLSLTTASILGQAPSRVGRRLVE